MSMSIGKAAKFAMKHPKLAMAAAKFAMHHPKIAMAAAKMAMGGGSQKSGGASALPGLSSLFNKDSFSLR